MQTVLLTLQLQHGLSLHQAPDTRYQVPGTRYQVPDLHSGQHHYIPPSIGGLISKIGLLWASHYLCKTKECMVHKVAAVQQK